LDDVPLGEGLRPEKHILLHEQLLPLNTVDIDLGVFLDFFTIFLRKKLVLIIVLGVLLLLGCRFILVVLQLLL
jgi:hypothetical protein